MGRAPLESDWQTFKASIEGWRDRYLQMRNQDYIEILLDDNLTPSQQFWIAKKKMQEDADMLNRIFDHVSRSRMYLILNNMCLAGLIMESDLDRFSDELQTQMREWLEEEEE